MLTCYREVGANISIKVYFLDSNLDRFPENCGDVHDEQEERFHKSNGSNGRHKTIGRALLRAMGQTYDGRLLLESKKGYKWRVFSKI